MCDNETFAGSSQASGDLDENRQSDGSAGPAADTQADVVEQAVEIKTADGTCDAALYCPQGQKTHPAVLMWTDVVGLRPVFRDMGRRLAAQGYVVLVPNPFYRWSRAPVVEGAANLGDPDVRAKLFALAGQFTFDGIARDSQSFIAFLDDQPQTDTSRKAGVHGYCMGGQFAMRTAAACPDRIGAVGSFHGSMLVTDDPLSPHRLVGKAAAAYLIGIAQDDDEKQPEAKTVLKNVFAEHGLTATVKVFAARHGWAVRGTTVYDEPQAEQAWVEICDLYKHTLA